MQEEIAQCVFWPADSRVRGVKHTHIRIIAGFLRDQLLFLYLHLNHNQVKSTATDLISPKPGLTLKSSGDTSLENMKWIAAGYLDDNVTHRLLRSLWVHLVTSYWGLHQARSELHSIFTLIWLSHCVLSCVCVPICQYVMWIQMDCHLWLHGSALSWSSLCLL